MTIAVSLNARYKFLDDDRLRLLKPNTACRERAAVVDIALDTEDYVTGGITVDLSVAQFTEVYALGILNGVVGGTYLAEYVKGTDATNGKIKLYSALGTEVTAATDITLTITGEIRGI